MRIQPFILWSLLGLAACSKPDPAPAPGSQTLAGAVATPLQDLNLVRAKIPEALLAAQRAPYAPPVNPTCAGLAAEIRGLDAALGEDLDASPAHPSPGLAERGKAEVGEAAIGVVQSNAEALIPFRGWVRKLTGAERASRQVTRAIAAGMVRRAYLKGLGQAKGCGAPAAPAGILAQPTAPVPTRPPAS